MPTQPQKRKINPLAIIAIILILLALGMLFLIFAPGPRMKWALTMGEKYLTDCEYTQAVTMFSRAIRVDDRSEPAYWGRAQAYVQLGDSAAATSDLTYIIDEIGTENADVYLTRADLYMDMGDTDAAQADLTAAASLGADTTAQASRLEALTRITVSLPTQIVNYDQLTGGTATLQYNADGALTDYTETYAYNGYTRTYTYDEHGNITSDSGLGQTYTNTYDADGNLLTHQAYNPDLFYTESYTYDDHGNVTHYDTDKPLESGNVTDWTYTYDDQGRITSKTGYLIGHVAATYTYTYTDEDYTEESDYWIYESRTHTYRTYSPEGVLRKEEVYTQYEGVDEYKTEETSYDYGKPFLTSYYDENGNVTAQKLWNYNVVDQKPQVIALHDVSQLENGFARYELDESGSGYYDFGDLAGAESVTNYTYTYDDDGNIIARTAYTDGVLTEEITYTVAKVPKDYSFDTVTEADYKYKEYVMAD